MFKVFYGYVVFTIALGNGALGQFPIACKHNITHRIGVCCPVPQGHIAPCGWPDRGRCHHYPEVEVTYYPEPPEGLDTDRLNWPHTYVRRGCVCTGNFYGPDCGKCKFGWEGERCDQKERMFKRRNILTYTEDERRIFRETLAKGKVTPSRLGAVIPPAEHHITGHVHMVELPILEIFQWIHYRASHHPLENCHHNYSMNWAHHGAHFPFWHRWIVLWTERELRQVSEDPDFTIPYWDWVGAESCEICSSDLIGKINLAGDEKMGELDERSQFASWRTLCHRMINKTKLNDECGTCDPEVDAGPIVRVKHGKWPKVEQVRSIFDYDTFEAAQIYVDIKSEGGKTKPKSFRTEMEKVHNTVHDKGYDGTMRDLTTAPNDPAFLIHHSFVDKLVEVWFHKWGKVPVHEYPQSNRHPGQLAGEPMVPAYPPDYAINYFASGISFGYEYDTICLSYEDDEECSMSKDVKRSKKVSKRTKLSSAKHKSKAITLLTLFKKLLSKYRKSDDNLP